MLFRPVVLMFAAVLLSGCGTLFNGSTGHIAVSSTPSEANVYVNGNLVGQTAMTVELDNHTKNQTITVKKEGYREASCVVATSHVRLRETSNSASIGGLRSTSNYRVGSDT